MEEYIVDLSVEDRKPQKGAEDWKSERKIFGMQNVDANARMEPELDQKQSSATIQAF
jgi:hypothetical protein